MNPQEITAYLAASHIAVVATVNRKGHPHLTPNWYRYDGKVGSLLLIIINFSRVSIKSDDLFVMMNQSGIVEDVISSKRTDNLEFRFWPFGD